jgi:hypothetical protein
MKISRTRLKEIIKGVMTEESEYQAFFQKALDKAGKSIPSMSEEEKKAFFDKIDSAWNGKGEKNEELVGGQKKLDLDKDGDIGSDDLADLRAGKKANESVNEEVKDWDTIHNVFVKFLKMNTKELEKRVLSKDEDATKKAIKSIVSGLTNAQRSLKMESVNEGKYDADLDKIEAAVKNASSFMSVGTELKKIGIKYDFTTSMMPMYMIKVSGNTIAIINKKYATDSERIVGDIAIGLLN